MRLLCAAALALTCGLWLAYGDDKNPAQIKAERTARFDELKKKFGDKFKELEAQHEKAQTDGEKRGVRVEMREETLLVVGKVLKVAEIDPKDEVGFTASAYIVEVAGRVGAGGPDVQKAVDFLVEHHVASPKIKDVLLFAMLSGKPGDKLLKAVAEKGADNDTKAVALVLRGYQAAQSIDDEADDKAILAAVKSATDILEAAKKMSPNAKIDDTTVAKFADDQLADVKKISGLLPGNPVPVFTSQTLDGKKATLADHKGKVVVLDFWSTRCGPCIEMIPHQREVVAKYKDRPFTLISASSDLEKKTLENFLQKQSMPWVHWWNDENTAQRAFRIWATPTVYIIDHTGVIRFRAIGEMDQKFVDKLIDDLVKDAEKAKG